MNGWFSNPQQKSLADYFRCIDRNKTNQKGVVLVQCVEDLYYFGLFGQISISLRKNSGIRIEQYVLRSLRVGEAKSLLTIFISRLFINPLHNKKWVKLYNLFCDGIAYRSTSFRPIDDTIDAHRAWICWKNLSSKQALLSVKISGICVGDLINDSFLRFKPAPTVKLNDIYLLVLIWQAHRDVRRAKEYLGGIKPKLYLTSYSTYIQHGIPVRVALQCGVKVYSFGNLQEFSKQLSLEDWVHTKNPDTYAKEFAALKRKEEKLALAETALSSRLSGGIDNATAYMKKSAYLESPGPVPDVENAVVVFLHDFYDSPHVYRKMVFPDFWEWICFTIETLTSANIRFFIKPHPNQVDLSDEVLLDLKNCYPGLPIISSGVTNTQLVKAGMVCAITVYGTIAHEMAFLGIPTIACAHHPHISFGFCRTASSKEEYAEFLRTPNQYPIDKAAMHRQSLIFYYMHNLNLSEEHKKLKDAAMEYRIACDTNDNQIDMILILTKMAESLQENFLRSRFTINENN